MTAARIKELYPTRATYVKAYRADLNRAVEAGYGLPADRKAMLAYVYPDPVPT